MEFARQLQLAQAGIRCVFPHGAQQHVSLLRRRSVPAWFQQNMTQQSEGDLDAVSASEQALHEIVDAEARAIGSQHVYLGGFSQGAAMALIVGLRYPQPLGRLILYASYLLRGVDVSPARYPANAETPLWIGHGRTDAVIALRQGLRVLISTAARGHAVAWHVYPGGHASFEGAADDLRRYLQCAVEAERHLSEVTT
jgi:phospholipase/carboxylesterase